MYICVYVYTYYEFHTTMGKSQHLTVIWHARSFCSLPVVGGSAGASAQVRSVPWRKKNRGMVTVG